MNFAHYIITRFNIGFRHWKRDKVGKEVRTENWLKQRLTLFNRFCYPSVDGQKNKNFKWILLLDEDGPPLLDLPGIRLYVSGVSWRETLKKYIRGDSDTSHIITTRLDNDDAIHEDTIKDIQECFSGQESEFLNLYNGFLLHEKKVYRTNHRSNQFLSLIETAKNLKTVYVDSHGNARKHGDVRQLTKLRYWIRVIHGSNMVPDNLSASTYIGQSKLKGFNIWP